MFIVNIDNENINALWLALFSVVVFQASDSERQAFADVNKVGDESPNCELRKAF